MKDRILEVRAWHFLIKAEKEQEKAKVCDVSSLANCTYAMDGTQSQLQQLQYKGTHVAIATAFHKVWHTALTKEIKPGQDLVFTHKLYLRCFENRSYFKRIIYAVSNITTIREGVLY